MKAFIATAVLALLPALSHAQYSEPQHQDTTKCSEWCSPYWSSMPKLEYVYWAAEAADCSTTLDIKNHSNLIETNPVLGQHPSNGKIYSYCVGTMLLHSAITYALIDGDVPKPLVNAWEWASIAVEAGFAAHNYSLGLRFKFK